MNDVKVFETDKPGFLFGELALLYNGTTWPRRAVQLTMVAWLLGNSHAPHLWPYPQPLAMPRW